MLLWETLNMADSRVLGIEPDPRFSGLSESIRAGWMYLDETVDVLQGVPGEPVHKDLDALEQEFIAGMRVAAYVTGLGVFFGMSRDLDGNRMVLTSITDGIKRIPPRNTYTDKDRIL